jgi:hypothetical protein
MPAQLVPGTTSMAAVTIDVQYRVAAAVLGLHLDGEIAKYLGELSIGLSIHQNGTLNRVAGFRRRQWTKGAVVAIF